MNQLLGSRKFTTAESHKYSKEHKMDQRNRVAELLGACEPLFQTAPRLFGLPAEPQARARAGCRHDEWVGAKSQQRRWVVCCGGPLHDLRVVCLSAAMTTGKSLERAQLRRELNGHCRIHGACKQAALTLHQLFRQCPFTPRVVQSAEPNQH